MRNVIEFGHEPNQPVASAYAAVVPRSSDCASEQPAARVLILSAGVGSGHQSAARGLREELLSTNPELRVRVRNGLGERNRPLRTFLERATRWQLTRLPSTYTLSYAVGVRWAPGRRLALAALYGASRSRLAALIDAERPDVVVSTYPGITAPLGLMRHRGVLRVPVCAVVTDIAGLHFWAHPGADLHLASYPESLEEITAITGGAPAAAAHPPLSQTHLNGRRRCDARRDLGLDPDRPLVVVSGGGWGVGDLRGAIDAALSLELAHVVAVCGENRKATERLGSRYAQEPRVTVLGYTDSMPDLLGAADVLVHSTGGMTCLEAAAQGCPVIAYGFSHGHVRQNVRTMVLHGLIRHAADSDELTDELRRVLRGSATLAPSRDSAVSASTAILGLIGRAATAPVGALQ